MTHTTHIFAVLLAVAVVADSSTVHIPQQIHLSYADGGATEMVVTWNTMEETSSPYVEFGETTDLGTKAVGYSTLFTDGGDLKRTQYIHRVKLGGLATDTLYYYKCGSSLGTSDTYYFRTMKDGSDWSARFLVFADMGVQNGQALPYLKEEALTNGYDAAVHAGDIAYDMDEDNARVGDLYMNEMQPIAAYMPYMVCPGNHEEKYNFSNYKARFSMPGDWENMFYSFDVGPVHFVAFNTEFYYYFWFGLKQIVRQVNWLEADLQEANKPENRALRPWIVTFGHRPMYCSTADLDDCDRRQDIIRVGEPFLHWKGLEDIFYDYGVDLEIWGHEHVYERTWPLYNRQVYNGTAAPYTNPGAPVHITTGAAGSLEETDPFKKRVPDWSAFRSDDYGYSRMTVANSTHLNFQQVSTVKSGQVIDEIWIIKDSHGSY